MENLSSTEDSYHENSNNETILSLISQITESENDLDTFIFYLSHFTTLLLDDQNYSLSELAPSIIDSRIVELLISKVCLKLELLISSMFYIVIIFSYKLETMTPIEILQVLHSITQNSSLGQHAITVYFKIIHLSFSFFPFVCLIYIYVYKTFQIS